MQNRAWQPLPETETDDPRRAAGRMLRAGALALEAIGRMRLGERDVRAGAEAIGRWCRALCALHGVTLHAAGRPPVAPSLLVARRALPLDPLALAALAPPSLPLVDAAAGRLATALAGAAGAIVVRDGATALRAVVRALRAGVSVIAFPDDGDASSRGLLGAARLAGVPVVQVAVHWEPALAGRDFLRDWLRVARRPRTVVRVQFGS